MRKIRTRGPCTHCDFVHVILYFTLFLIFTETEVEVSDHHSLRRFPVFFPYLCACTPLYVSALLLWRPVSATILFCVVSFRVVLLLFQLSFIDFN